MVSVSLISLFDMNHIWQLTCPCELSEKAMFHSVVLIEVYVSVPDPHWDLYYVGCPRSWVCLCCCWGLWSVHCSIVYCPSRSSPSLLLWNLTFVCHEQIDPRFLKQFCCLSKVSVHHPWFQLHPSKIRVFHASQWFWECQLQIIIFQVDCGISKQELHFWYSEMVSKVMLLGWNSGPSASLSSLEGVKSGLCDSVLSYVYCLPVLTLISKSKKPSVSAQHAGICVSWVSS